MSVSVTEGDRWVASGDQPVGLERIYHLNSVFHEDGVIGPEVDSSWGLHVLDRPQ